MAAALAAENNGMNEAWPDICDEEYIQQFQPEPSHKIQQ